MISKNYLVQAFVPKEIYSVWGDKAAQFVSDNIIRVFEFLHVFFNNYYKALDSNVESVQIVCNNYYDADLIKLLGHTFNWRGLRTFDYIKSQLDQGIKTAKISQHVGGSTNAGDFNVIITFKGGKKLVKNSGEIHDIIMKNQKQFLDAGLTTLEDKAMTPGWVHADCRFTGLQEIYIVKP
jgi:hypothetical protein